MQVLVVVSTPTHLGMSFCMLSEVGVAWASTPVTLHCLFLVGASLSQTDASELKFLYEGHEDFSVLPSFAVIPAQVGECCLMG